MGHRHQVVDGVQLAAVVVRVVHAARRPCSARTAGRGRRAAPAPRRRGARGATCSVSSSRSTTTYSTAPPKAAALLVQHALEDVGDLVEPAAVGPLARRRAAARGRRGRRSRRCRRRCWRRTCRGGRRRPRARAWHRARRAGCRTRPRSRPRRSPGRASGVPPSPLRAGADPSPRCPGTVSGSRHPQASSECRSRCLPPPDSLRASSASCPRFAVGSTPATPSSRASASPSWPPPPRRGPRVTR